MNFENNAKGLIDKLIYMNESTVKSEEILSQLDGIAAMEGENRDLAVGEYFLELYKQVYTDSIKYRELAANDMSILKEDQELRLMDAQVVLNDISKVFDSYFSEAGVKVCEGKLYLGLDPLVIQYTINGVCNQFKAIDTLKNAGKNRNIDLLNEMREGFEHLAASGHKYTASNFSTDAMIEEMYVVHEERAAQFAQKSFWAKLRHPIDSIKTYRFLNKVEKALKKVGFDKEKHGAVVKERFANEPCSILKVQMATAKDNCKKMQEEIKLAEWRKDNPILTVAQEKFKKAQAYFEDKEHPERTFKTKIGHIIDKYNLPADKEHEFTKVNLNYQGMATDFDGYRDTGLFIGHRDTQFFDVCRTFLNCALRKDEPIDIKQILRDANELLVTEFQTFSVLYEREELKDLAKEGMIPKGGKLDFLQRKLLDAVGKKRDADEVERVKNEMQEFIDDYTNNREQYYEQEMQMLESAESVIEPLVIIELKEDPTKDVELSMPIVEVPVTSKETVAKN